MNSMQKIDAPSIPTQAPRKDSVCAAAQIWAAIITAMRSTSAGRPNTAL